MMGKSYQRKTSRSKRKMPSTPQGTVSVETADGQAQFQMMLPMNLLLFDVATAIEETANFHMWRERRTISLTQA